MPLGPRKFFEPLAGPCIPGVGAVTALAYRATIDVPARFPVEEGNPGAGAGLPSSGRLMARSSADAMIPQAVRNVIAYPHES
jgi:hypothetical protein